MLLVGDLQKKLKVFGLFGSTASGKSFIAEKLVQFGKFRVINADSRQIYRYLNVLSAIGEVVPENHVLYAAIDPANRITSQQWIDLVLSEIKSAHAEGFIPLLVGGTGMYFWFLQNGYAQIPEILSEIQHKIEKYSFEEQKQFLPAFITDKFKDPMRISRALAVFWQTNRHITEYFAQPHSKKHYYDLTFFGLKIEKAELWSNIERRTENMFPTVLDEVANFRKMYPNIASDVIGFAEICAFLDKKISLVDLKQKVIFKTRQYAKRQNTYMKKLKFTFISDNACDLYNSILKFAEI